jgi:hypothetical protein
MGTQIDDKDISPQKFFNDFEELENSNYYCIWNMIFKIPKWPLEFSLLVFLGHVNLLYLLEIPKETLSKTESPSGEFGFLHQDSLPPSAFVTISHRGLTLPVFPSLCLLF